MGRAAILTGFKGESRIRMNRRQLVSTLVMTGVIACAGVVPASAAAPTGATVYKQVGCVDYGPVEVCGTIHSTITVVNTPSGHVIMRGSTRYDTTIIPDEGHSYSTTGSMRSHLLRKDGQNATYHDQLTETLVDPTLGTCRAVIDVHFADGEFQFQQRSFECV
jgi:hypothetical protein